MDASVLVGLLVFGTGLLVMAYYGFRRMRSEDEHRLSGRSRPEVSSFARDKERAEVAEAERRVGGDDTT